MVRDPRFRIYYLVPHPRQNPADASPLQLYTPGILKTATIFEVLAKWPGDIREWSSAPKHTLFLRALGYLDRRVSPIEIPSFDGIVGQEIPLPFMCVISTQDTFKSVEESLSRSRIPWLHLTTHDGAGVPSFWGATPAMLRTFCRGALDAYLRLYPDVNFEFYARSLLADEPYGGTIRIKEPSRGAGVTRSNEIALEAFGYRFQKHAPLTPNDPSSYVDASLHSALIVERRRRQMLAGRDVDPRNSFIVTAWSPAWSVRRRTFDRRRLADAKRGRQLAEIWDSMLNQEHHLSELTVESAKALREEPLLQSTMHLRQREAFAYVASLTAYAAHDLTPVLRFEPRVNRIRHQLIDIGNCARGNGPHRQFKLNKLLMRMSKSLTDLIDPKYRERLTGSPDRIEGLSLVSDLPLEFLVPSELPLSLTHDCSRIPLNPGNASFGQLLHHTSLPIEERTFADVLILRSFSSSDPLRGVLENAIRHYSHQSDNTPNVKFVDVNTPAEFIQAANSFSGAVMIFDGHGVRNPDHHTGTIVVGGEEMDLWKYRKEIELPPIVLLSACDTMPLDGAHGAVATGLLAAGARTVLSTFLPISGVHGANFVGRLLFRMADYLPIAARYHAGRPMEWRGFLAGLLRMAHVSEIVKDTAARFNLPDDIFSSIQLPANTAINSRRPDWHLIASKKMRELLPPESWQDLPHTNPLARPTEALLYVQVGRAESIHIVPNRPDLTRFGQPTAETVLTSNQQQP